MSIRCGYCEQVTVGLGLFLQLNKMQQISQSALSTQGETVKLEHYIFQMRFGVMTNQTTFGQLTSCQLLNCWRIGSRYFVAASCR